MTGASTYQERQKQFTDWKVKPSQQKKSLVQVDALLSRPEDEVVNGRIVKATLEP